MKIQVLIPLLLVSQAVTPLALALNHETASRSTQRIDYDDAAMIKPKMNGKIPSTSVLQGKSRITDRQGVKSKVAYYIGNCSSDSPFRFDIGGKAGRGSIGVPSSEYIKEALTLSFVNTEEDGKVTIMNNKVSANFFASLSQKEEDSMSSHRGIPFKYRGRTSNTLSTVELKCPNQDPMDVIVIVGDDDQKYAKARVNRRHDKEETQLKLLTDVKATKDLQAAPLESFMMTDESSFGDEDHHSIKGNLEGITWKRNQGGHRKKKQASECSLVQMTIRDSNGQEVPKTLVVCDDEQNESVRRRRLLSKNDYDRKLKVDSADIDENGDILFNFASLLSNEQEPSEHGEEIMFVKFDARIGINSECKDETIEVVDMDAMLPSSKPTMIVNGGWFRRAMELHGINDCQWEPVVIDAIVTDPDSRYSYLAHLSAPAEVKVMTGVHTNGANRKLTSDELDNRRKLLTARASSEEMDITKEMTMGRKPENILSSGGTINNTGGRNLSNSIHKKILVHGYCSTGDTFPPQHFSDAIEFVDPDTTRPRDSSWSNDVFARKIARFGDQNNLNGCGIIAHSQGGLAALHLYTYYWSCLDYSEYGTHMIQSVGSPYQGSDLAGSLAGIGVYFGAGKRKKIMYDQTTLVQDETLTIYFLCNHLFAFKFIRLRLQ